jgi:hypothetical protein
MYWRNFISRYVVLVLALLLYARAASAQTLTINFDEYGNGSIQPAGGGSIPLQSLGNITDPFDPGNGMKPLGYSIAASLGGLVPINGDMIVQEPAIGTVSDVIRWYQGLLLVYSELPEIGEINPPPADVGLPQLFQSNTIVVNETGPESGPNGVFGYNPGFTGPGAISSPAIYNFTSDYAIPEPGSFALFGLAAGLMLLRRRRRAAA